MNEDEHPNCQAIDIFLTAIPSISRPICHTHRVDDRTVSDGYMSAWHDSKKNEGFTIIALNGGDLILSIERAGMKTEIHYGKIEEAKAYADLINETFFNG